MSYLVIVESPSKAKSIEKYLGSKYKVTASMGHLRDLPKSKLGIDIENNFEPQYTAIHGKGDLVKELRKLAAASDGVYLATDPDREGEAISWHLKELLNLNDKTTKRVTFNEITPKVVLESMKNPRDIDLNLVDAQQARRLLDRIVGYKLSPFLWKKVRKGLSAGRVQSVVTRIVIDRENEIRDFKPQEYWTIDAQLTEPKSGESFTASFYGDLKKKFEPCSREETTKIIQTLQQAEFTVSSVKKSSKQVKPTAPFNTSSLQQEASRKLGMIPRRTMSVAQQLYEGVDIPGHGSIGLITYMRTDSLRLSSGAVSAARDFISEKYGAEYCPKSPRVYKTKKSAQDAHEAIRPTYVNIEPDSIKASLTAEQYKLYKMIWSRFVACQMESAVYDVVAVEITAGGYRFRASSSKLVFPGYSKVYVEGRDEEEKSNARTIPELSEKDRLNLEKLIDEQHFTGPPSRYTEASLVRAMEEKGIGRPSTYAPTISTIIDRGYVERQGKTLAPTPLGEVVNSLMMQQFTDIIDVEFTANMEMSLDEIEEGKKAWKDTLSEFYEPFAERLTEAEKELEGKYFRVPDEETEIVCEKCGRKMVIKNGRYGKFLACPGYPECANAKPIVEETPGECPLCGGKILKKRSKNKYAYYGCENFPTCTFMTWGVPQAERCPDCDKTMYKPSGRGSRKLFCGNPACKSYVPQEKRTKKTTEDKSTAKTAAKKTAKGGAKTAAKKTVKKSAGAAKTKSTRATAKKSDAASSKKPAKSNVNE